MKKILTSLLTLILLSLGVSAHSQVLIMSYQTPRTAYYVKDYADFDNEYRKTRDLKNISRRYNLLYMLLLDPTYLNECIEFNPEIESTYKLYREALLSGEQTVVFDSDIKEITHLLKRGKHMSKAMDAIFGENGKYTRIVGQVCVKDDCAVAVISNSSSRAYYHFRLRGNKVEATLLSRELDFELDKETSISNNSLGWGLRIGIGTSTMTERVRDDSNNQSQGVYNYSFSYNIGVTYDISLNKTNTITLQPGLFFSKVGAIDNSTIEKITVNLNYIKLPVLFVQRLGGKNNSSFDAYYGFYFANGIGGKTVTKAGGRDVTIDSFGDNNTTMGFNKFDGGLSIGVGATFNRFIINLMMDLGMSDLSRGTAIQESNPNLNYTLNNQTIMLNVGFNFGKK